MKRPIWTEEEYPDESAQFRYLDELEEYAEWAEKKLATARELLKRWCTDEPLSSIVPATTAFFHPDTADTHGEEA